MGERQHSRELFLSGLACSGGFNVYYYQNYLAYVLISAVKWHFMASLHFFRGVLQMSIMRTATQIVP